MTARLDRSQRSGCSRERGEQRPAERVADDDHRRHRVLLDEIPQLAGHQVSIRIEDQGPAAGEIDERAELSGAVHQRAARELRKRIGLDRPLGDVVEVVGRGLTEDRIAAGPEHGEQITLGPHHTLRHAGGPAGVDHQDVVLAPTPRADHAVGAGRDDRLVVDRPIGLGLAVGHHVPALHQGQLRADLVEQRSEARMEHHRLGVGVVEEVGDLVWPVSVVGVERHQAGLERGHVGLEVGGIVVEIGGDLRLLVQPGRQEIGSQGVGPPIEVVPGVDRVAEDLDRPTGNRSRHRFEDVAVDAFHGGAHYAAERRRSPGTPHRHRRVPRVWIWHGVGVAPGFLASARRAARDAGVPIPAEAETAAESQAVALPLDPGLDPWVALGVAYEASLGPDERSSRGAHFTPRWLADAMVARTVDATSGPVIDPACGTGVFLLAALDRLVACGVRPVDALARVVGHDIDRMSLDVADLCLRWWAHAHDAEYAGPVLIEGDPLLRPDTWRPGDLAPVVVANPPFLDQLDGTSARTAERRAALQRRFGDEVAAYTDDAALFLAWAVDTAGATGTVAMVLPRSMLATRDGRGVRRRVTDHAALRTVWFDDADTFAAGVRVCVVVLDVGGVTGQVDVCAGRSFETLSRVPSPDANTWSPLLAAAEGVPAVALPGGAVLGDHVEVVAGFRDEYYGLAGAVVEPGEPSDLPRLVTSGAIDLAELRWADQPIRFAKHRWHRPRVDVTAIESEGVRTWVRRLMRPKILVATQTRVVEAAVDDVGDCVGSVPVLNVMPIDHHDLWRFAAVLAAPPVTAWALSRRAGTALSAGALKLAADDIRAVPLPTDRIAWDAGAGHFEDAHAAGSREERVRALDHFGRSMTEAYACDASVFEWWTARRG